ncbi:MAG: beta-galactosidase [Armatimonadota bacterium]
MDKYGGNPSVTGRRTGFFHTEQVANRWRLIDPLGNAFVTIGVCHASYQGDVIQGTNRRPYNEAVEKRYGSESAWAKAVAERLRSWGFNTIGAWSSPSLWTQDMAYTVILNLGAASVHDAWLRGGFPDVFSPRFREAAERVARALCRPRRDDPWLLGYFTDNELRWGPDWRSPRPLFDDFFTLGSEGHGKKVLVDMLRRRYGSLDALNRTWDTRYKSWEEVTASTDVPEPRSPEGKSALDKDRSAFLELAARQYFQVCRDVITAEDPNHMILGCRFAGYAPEPVLRGMKGLVDVVSYNDYSAEAPVERLRDIYAVVEAPMMLTEFSFKAMDSGLPNTRGAGEPVETQKDRADGFERYVRRLMAEPYMVGYHWFEWADEPKEGRFDGENNNYGLVDIADNPWQVLVERMTRVNREIAGL